VNPPPVVTPVITSSCTGNGFHEWWYGGDIITGSNFLGRGYSEIWSKPGHWYFPNWFHQHHGNDGPLEPLARSNVVVVNTNAASATNLNGFAYVVPPPPPPQQTDHRSGQRGNGGFTLDPGLAGQNETPTACASVDECEAGAAWTSVGTNILDRTGGPRTVCRSIWGEPKRFYGLSVPSDIVVVQAPSGLQTIPSGSTNAIGLAWTASSTPASSATNFLRHGQWSDDQFRHRWQCGLSANVSGLVGADLFSDDNCAYGNGQSVASDTLSAQTGMRMRASFRCLTSRRYLRRDKG